MALSPANGPGKFMFRERQYVSICTLFYTLYIAHARENLAVEASKVGNGAASTGGLPTLDTTLSETTAGSKLMIVGGIPEFRTRSPLDFMMPSVGSRVTG